MRNTGSKRRAMYFFGGNGVRDLYLQEQMAQFAQLLPAFEFIPVVYKPAPEDGWQGQTGLVTDAVKKNVADVSGYEGYLCGSPGMIDASIKVLVSLGMPEKNIYYDKFA
jgi:NAD(P)H-flavin reductase